MWTLGIDPGKDGLGWALAESPDRILICGLSRTKEKKIVAAAFEHLANLENSLRSWEDAPGLRIVVERMQVDGRTDRRKFQALLDLNWLGGWLCGNLWRGSEHETHAPEPRKWKGKIKKAVHHRRILRDLGGEPSGLSEVTPYLRHNTMDAVGLALWGASLA